MAPNKTRGVPVTQFERELATLEDQLRTLDDAEQDNRERLTQLTKEGARAATLASVQVDDDPETIEGLDREKARVTTLLEKIQRRRAEVFAQACEASRSELRRSIE